MSFTTKFIPHSLIGIVSVLPALLIMPAIADVDPVEPVDPNAPNISADTPAWVFGDITLAGAPVSMATIGGRRMAWNDAGTKYQNDIPKYHMVGRSLTVTGSDVYVGPISLQLGELANDAVFAYNYQWDTDNDNINNDVDLANWAGVTWGEEYADIYAKLAAKINLDPDDPNYYDNAGDTADGVYMVSRRDENKVAGTMSFANSNVRVNGTTVNADTINVTNSTIKFINETTYHDTD